MVVTASGAADVRTQLLPQTVPAPPSSSSRHTMDDVNDDGAVGSLAELAAETAKRGFMARGYCRLNGAVQPESVAAARAAIDASRPARGG
jgi:hypothetical protein